ncbi:hypothetical protein WJX81_008109 [Elliptochloris bilobata]|uniref:MI domain-containing protein n=1 Tax=Elliptochloris bilobata TaxID=381761 RepID=A0AAW1R179_9CHLO
MRGGPDRRQSCGRGCGAGPALPFKLAKELGLPGAARRGGPPQRGRGRPARGTGRGRADEAGGKRRRADGQQLGDAKRQRRAEPSARTKFEELLEPHLLRGATAAAAEAEAALQRQLARKLGIKGTKRKALAAAASISTEAAGAAQLGALGRRPAGGKAEHAGGGAADAAAGLYVPPAARAAAREGGGREEGERLARRVTGLLNRLAEVNVAAVAGELTALYESAGRGAVSAAVASELLQAVAEGPRATERFAAVAAALVAGLAALTQDAGVGARFTAQLAKRLEAAVAEGDSLAAGNLAAVAAQLYLAGLLPAATLYSLLAHLRARFAEQDVALIWGLLNAAGFQLRRDDPAAMKEFVVAVHARAAEAAEADAMSSRAQVLLSLVLDIKNNRRRSGRGAPAPPAALAPAAQRFLKDAGVDAVQLRSLPWGKLLLPEQKGMWWLPSAGDTDALPPMAGAGAALAGGDDLDVGGGGVGAVGSELGLGLRDEHGAEAGGGQLLRLAAAQRMSTEARRAVFCVVLGSQDCADALERLLRLPLKGEAQRELVRVTAECCLQERVWNPYYAHLLVRLAAAAKGHRITLQFCLLDHFKQAAKEDARRLANLARLTAEVMAGGALAPTALKAVDFSTAMAPRELLLWRAAFAHLLAACRTPEAAAALFSRLAAAPDLAPWRAGLGLWLRARFGPWLAQPGAAARMGCAADADALLLRLRAAERGLKGGAGAL